MAAEFLRSQCFDRIYAQAPARTLATAKELSEALGDLPVTVVPALAACAAAVKKRGLENPPFLAPTEMARMCPRIDSFGESAPKSQVAWVSQQTPQALVVSPRFGPRESRRRRLRERWGRRCRTEKVTPP